MAPRADKSGGESLGEIVLANVPGRGLGYYDKNSKLVLVSEVNLQLVGTTFCSKLVSLPANVPSYILETDVGNPGIQNKSTVSCEVCGNILPNEKALETHIQTNHGQVNVSNMFFSYAYYYSFRALLLNPT